MIPPFLSFPCSRVLDHISPIFSPFFPVFARFHRLAETVPTSPKPKPRAKKQPEGGPRGEDSALRSTRQALTKGSTGSRFKRTSAVTRHLVVYSGPESLKDDNTQGQNRFSFNANVSERDLEAYFYPPFEACISRTRGNSAGAMCSDAAQNGVPSCASELLMAQKPRDWNASEGFYVVSDMGSCESHGSVVFVDSAGLDGEVRLQTTMFSRRINTAPTRATRC